jgi:hypothetical protein
MHSNNIIVTTTPLNVEITPKEASDFFEEKRAFRERYTFVVS